MMRLVDKLRLITELKNCVGGWKGTSYVMIRLLNQFKKFFKSVEWF